MSGEVRSRAPGANRSWAEAAHLARPAEPGHARGVNRLVLFFAASCCVAAPLGCTKKDDLMLDRDWTRSDASGQAPWREVESLFASKGTETNPQSFALRGVRHGLTMSAHAAPSARCTCLDVVVGAATDPRLSWMGETPTLSRDQVALAVRTQGSTCSAPEGQARRPSIFAVDIVNGDTVVVVEELPVDRPQALGAIVPLPQSGRSVFVRARGDKGHVAMYAQGPQGPRSMCRVLTRGAAPSSTPTE